ncbi:unnamed protein product [Chironomus riparius]|uniref:LRRCT domain-containing protein n=1 Tax=Chironomus riparius TaxID=315576 RepID=A0A9N9S260_9DIPT|nr:unnamed protein product [Chironomus riparius]
MESLSIDGKGLISLTLEVCNIFTGATSLKSIKFTDFVRINFDPNVLSLLSQTLTHLEISKSTDPNQYFRSRLPDLLQDSNLQKIEFLNFQQHNITNISLSKHIFESSKDSIKILNLANLHVISLTNDTFAGCNQLKELHLENNLIKELPPGIFNDLENLEMLFLQNNLLTTIPEKLFDTQLNSQSLSILDLSENFWFCDSKLLYLKNFLLSTTAEVTINNCDGPKSLAGRPIKDLWCNVDSCMIYCEFTARLELLKELEDIDMSSCTEVELHLKYHTFNEETLSDQWLSQLDFSIHKLTIAHSNIKSIKNGTFNSILFENLRELIIDHNNETDLVIEQDGFLGLKSIEVLKIERTAGLSLNSENNILEPIKVTLKEISVSYLIEPFNPRLLFENTELLNLKVLHLTGNKFEFIEFTSTTFEGLHENLEEIFIVNSEVINITTDAFSGFKNLKNINLSGSYIESLDGQFFGSNSDKKLVSINLSNLKLKNIEIDTFNGCKQLLKLSLSGNSIESLNPGLFDDLENLEFLDLQDNLLTNIPDNLFKTQLESENLKLINFTNNPWNCDIEIIHLKQFLIKTEAEILIDGCANPNLYGEDIKDLWCRQKECQLICEKTDDTTLPENCDATSFYLISHHFVNRTIRNNSLSDIKFNVDKMHFKGTDIESIENNAFKLTVFENLQELKISKFTKYSCYINQYGLSGLNSIKVITFESLKGLKTFTSYSIFSTVQNTVKEITVKGIIEPINVFQMFNKPNFTNLQVIMLSENILNSEINTQTFRGAHETLEEIYLRHTRNVTTGSDAFSMFENLKIADFEGSDLYSLDGPFFGNNPEKNKIKSINLFNTKLESLGNETFVGCKQLTVLDLSNNSLSFIETGTFDDLENLEYLHLQNNLLESIPKNLFKIQLEADKLKFMDLSSNLWMCDGSITYLKHFLEFTKAEIIINGCVGPEKFLNQTIKDFIQKLSIDKSPIEVINENAFNSKVFGTLESLVMTRNFNSCFITSTSFAGLDSIEFIEIDQSPVISWISTAYVFAPVRKTLKELRLTNIKEYFNAGELFEKTQFEKLKILRLDGNDFTWLNESYFAGTHETLEEMHLRGSKISKLNANTFSGFKNLKLIDLRDNKLTTMESSVFGDGVIDDNFKVLISGNEWNCTCDIEFLLDFIADEVNVTCKSPDELAEKNIFDLEEICVVPTTTTEEPTTTTSSTTPTTSTTEESTTTTTQKPTTTTKKPTDSTKSDANLTSDVSTTPETSPTPTTVSLSPSTSTPSTTTSIDVTTTSSTPDTATTTTTEGPENSGTTTTVSSEPDYNTTTSENPEVTTPSGSSTRPTTTSPKSQSTPNYITCYDPDNPESTSQSPWHYDFQSRYLPSNVQIPLDRPHYEFKSIKTKVGTLNEVSIEINDFPFGSILLYYPSTDDPFAPEKVYDERYSIRCQTVTKTLIFVKNLAPNVIYNFCLIINVSNYQLPYISPFQCRSYEIEVGQPWLYEEQKTVILTSLSLLIIMALIVGIIMTYCLIRQIPTLIKGSKRVVLVNNRAREVMILPRNSTQSSSQSVSSSCHKEAVTPIHNEAPTYLTPLPRQSFDQRPPFHRSSSDTSLKSYVSVSRLPPRFSQVYQRDDFDTACFKHQMSYPHCPPTAPYQPLSDIPPPLPRRSIVSNSSSTQHSCASTAELGRTMSRAHNSTYRRHPRPIEIEQENHYNVII